MSIERRRFLGWSGTALGSLALGASGSVAGAEVTHNAGATTAATMWRLESDWGFPLAPSGRTSCRCAACVGHSANKLFFSRAAAENGRAHPGCCCLAMPVSVDVPVRSLEPLSRNGASVDRRDPAVATLLGDLGNRV